MIQKIPDFARALDVYWDATLVGRLMQSAAGALSFAYDLSFLQTAHVGISISMPPQEATFEGVGVKAFFSGLLPEESVRVRLAQYLGLSVRNDFALLEAVGGDCAGALALYPMGEGPPPVDVRDCEIVDDQRLVEILKVLRQRPFLVDGGVRLSLAGAQDKLAIGFENGQVLLMKRGQPTTHILKPIIEHVADSVHNEFFCMRLAHMIGLEVPRAEISFVDDMPCYIVERFDRVRQPDGTIKRLHQEDFCQALGVLPELKYEREGGPSFASCQKVIVDHVERPAADQIKFLDIVVFNYLIGNADAHSKNFSLLYRSQKPELAPAYDLLSTAVYPHLSSKMAMKIGGKYNPDQVTLRHWHSLVPSTKVAQNAMNKKLERIADRAIQSAYTLKKDLESQGLGSNIFTDICQVIERRGRAIAYQVRN